MSKGWVTIIICIIIMISFLIPVTGQISYGSSNELDSYFGDFLRSDAGQSPTYYSGTSHSPGSTYQGISFQGVINQGGTNGNQGLMPASGYYTQQFISPSIQNFGASSNEFVAAIPYIPSESGQVRSDGIISKYPNAGISGNSISHALLSFDISRIPSDAVIEEASLEFRCWDMIGSPFSRLGSLNIYPTSYNTLGPNCYYYGFSENPILRVFSSGELNMPISSNDLVNSLQAAIGQSRFQLRMQYDQRNVALSGGNAMTSSSSFSVNSNANQIRYSLQSENIAQNQYYILSPGINLSRLSISQEMLKESINLGSVKVANLPVATATNVDNAPSIPSRDNNPFKTDLVYDELPCPPDGSGTSEKQPDVSSNQDTGNSQKSETTIPDSFVVQRVFYREPVIQPQIEEDLIRLCSVTLRIKYSLPKIIPPKVEPKESSKVFSKILTENTPPDLGVGNFSQPETSILIDASPAGWGQVPANQVLAQVDLTLSFEQARAIASTLAAVLGGQVVGELEYINLFQIETPSQSLNELIRDVNGARKYPSIIFAFPNLQVYRESCPLENRVYRGENGKSFEIIGVRKCWEDIDSSRINLSKVHVGVTDDGIYKGYGEFNQLDINTSIEIYPGAPASQLSSPVKGFETIGSHGTGVMNMLAADPDNGGLVGIASEPLRSDLNCDMINIFDKNRCFITTSLLGLKYEIEDGCTIFSISWGNSSADEQAVQMYEKWFKKLSNDYPQLLFVCSAGNEGEAIDGSRRIPNGFGRGNDSLPNIITVGNINNTGEICEHSNRNLYRNYVTLAAPGEQSVWGMNNSGDIINFGGGTSMAAPQVAAAASLIRSINPSLTADEIKTILLETTNQSVGDVEAPGDLGGGILAVGKAVEKTIKERPAECEAPSNITGPIAIPTYADINVQGNRDTNAPGNPIGNFGTVEGKIYERNTGAGIASAELSYKDWSKGDEIMTGIMTDSNGLYQLNLPPGQYQIGARASGYGIIPSAVTVNQRQTSETNLKAVKGVST
jgi:hypothetical protein